VGFCRIFRHFSGFGLFPALKPNPRPSHQRLTQTVGTPFAQQKESLNRKSGFIVKV
jgi:hypothetical protein